MGLAGSRPAARFDIKVSSLSVGCFHEALDVSAQSIRFLAITQAAVLFPSGEGRRARDFLLLSFSDGCFCGNPALWGLPFSAGSHSIASTDPEWKPAACASRKQTRLRLCSAPLRRSGAYRPCCAPVSQAAHPAGSAEPNPIQGMENNIQNSSDADRALCQRKVPRLSAVR